MESKSGQLKNDIFDANYPEKQIKAAYQLRYVRNDHEAVSILFRACYEAINPKLQQESVRSLGVLKPDRALETFIKSTFSRDTDKRMRAYYHLGTLNNPRGIDVVLKGLEDPKRKVRKAAVVSAGRLGDNFEVIEALKKLLIGFEPGMIKNAAKISINMIHQRVNDGKYKHPKRSFNKTGQDNNMPETHTAETHTAKTYTAKTHTAKTYTSKPYRPKAYTPKCF